MVMQGLSESIIGRAAQKGLLSVETINIRDYTLDRHKKVDDYPYGGGAGMLMQAQPVFDAWKAVEDGITERKNRESGWMEPLEYEMLPDTQEKQSGQAAQRTRTVYVTPQGATFTQQMAKELAKEEDVIFLCGHYEGIDERVLEEIVTDYVSIGDYVLTGGELPAMVMIDAISRMVPGVLTNGESGATESFEGNLLEYPQYSRPEEWHGKRVPEILLSGNQRKIDEWRREEAVKRTKERRPDLYQKYERGQECITALKNEKLLHVDMTELIARGQARIVFAEGANVCLQDMTSGIYFHTAEDVKTGYRMLETLKEDAASYGIKLLVLHQDFMVEPAKKQLGLSAIMTCSQVVYTKREKLPITGLYSMDGKVRDGQPAIRPLQMEHLKTVIRHYDTMADMEYIRERIEKGAMFGAFFGEELAGFAGLHTEGSIGMLYILPEYRGRKLGKALETYLINYCLERGYTPFGQVVVGNEISKLLQESLGLCFSKSRVYWLEQK